MRSPSPLRGPAWLVAADEPDPPGRRREGPHGGTRARGRWGPRLAALLVGHVFARAADLPDPIPPGSEFRTTALPLGVAAAIAQQQEQRPLRFWREYERLTPQRQRTVETFVAGFVRGRGVTLSPALQEQLTAAFRQLAPEWTDAELARGGEVEVTELQTALGVCRDIDRAYPIARQLILIGNRWTEAHYVEWSIRPNVNGSAGGNIIVLFVGNAITPSEDSRVTVAIALKRLRSLIWHELIHVHTSPLILAQQTTPYLHALVRRLKVVEGGRACQLTVGEFAAYLATMARGQTSPGHELLRLSGIGGQSLEAEPAATELAADPAPAPVEPRTARIHGPRSDGSILDDPSVRVPLPEPPRLPSIDLGPSEGTVTAARLIVHRFQEDFGPAVGVAGRMDLRFLLDRVSADQVRDWSRREYERCFGPLPEATFEVPPEVIAWLERPAAGTGRSGRAPPTEPGPPER